MGVDYALHKQTNFVAAATDALARLNADRLEEMARTCDELSRGIHSVDSVCEALALERQEAVHEMTILSAVIEATRVNRRVLRRLGEARPPAIGYGYGPEGQ